MLEDYSVSSNRAMQLVWSTTRLLTAALCQLVKLHSELESCGISGLLKQLQTNSNLLPRKMHTVWKPGKGSEWHLGESLRLPSQVSFSTQ